MRKDDYSHTPALAYFYLMEKKSRIEDISEWQPSRNYRACPPMASDLDVEAFLATKAISQCVLCPSRRVAFNHPERELARGGR